MDTIRAVQASNGRPRSRAKRGGTSRSAPLPPPHPPSPAHVPPATSCSCPHSPRGRDASVAEQHALDPIPAIIILRRGSPRYAPHVGGLPLTPPLPLPSQAIMVLVRLHAVEDCLRYRLASGPRGPGSRAFCTPSSAKEGGLKAEAPAASRASGPAPARADPNHFSLVGTEEDLMPNARAVPEAL